LTVTISIGVAGTLGESDTSEALLKRADEALYEAKAAGRNRVISSAA
jgi:two-component system cell cycle response regulator